jgi:hypothetical protein
MAHAALLFSDTVCLYSIGRDYPSVKNKRVATGAESNEIGTYWAAADGHYRVVTKRRCGRCAWEF